jgi:hypothetical protein
MIAGLIAFDAMSLFTELRGIPVSGDGVAWFNGCEVLDAAALAELIARGERAGMTVLLSTTSESAAASLAADVNVVAIHRLADPVAAGQLAAALAGPGLAAGKAGAAAGPPGRLAAGGGPAVPGPAAAQGAALSAAPDHVPGANGSVPHAGRAVPPWAQRMPVPAAAGAPAAGIVAPPQGPGGHYPFQKSGSPMMTPDTFLHLRPGGFALLVKGPERRLLPRCQAVPARIPGRPG